MGGKHKEAEASSFQEFHLYRQRPTLNVVGSFFFLTRPQGELETRGKGGFAR